MFGIVYWESYFFVSLNLNFIAVLGTDCSDFLAFVIVHVDQFPGNVVVIHPNLYWR